MLPALPGDCDPFRVDAGPGDALAGSQDDELPVGEVAAVDPEHQQPRRRVMNSLKFRQSSLCYLLSSNQ